MTKIPALKECQSWKNDAAHSVRLRYVLESPAPSCISSDGRHTPKQSMPKLNISRLVAAAVRIAMQSRGDSGDQKIKISISVVKSAICRKGKRDPVVFGQIPSSFR